MLLRTFFPTLRVLCTSNSNQYFMANLYNICHSTTHTIIKSPTSLNDGDLYRHLKLTTILIISHLIHLEMARMKITMTSMIILRRKKFQLKTMMKSTKMLMCQETATVKVLSRVLKEGFYVIG